MVDKEDIYLELPCVRILCPGDWGDCDFNSVVDKEDIYLALPCVRILCNSACYLYRSRNRKYLIIGLATVKSDIFCEW